MSMNPLNYHVEFYVCVCFCGKGAIMVFIQGIKNVKNLCCRDAWVVNLVKCLPSAQAVIPASWH